MEAEFKITDECEGTFRAYADAAEVNAMRIDILKRISRGVSIPGFRPGKAPLNFLMKHFRKNTDELMRERILGDALDLLESSEQDKIIVDYSEQEINESDEGAFEVLIHVAFIPAFELPQYKGIKVTKGSVDVTDGEIDEYLAIFAKSAATYSTEERPATADDCIIVDFTTTVDGKPASEACAGKVCPIDDCEDYELERDGDLPMLFNALVGAVAGEESVHEFDPDDSFIIPELRGKHIVIKCKVKEVRSVHVLDVTSEEFLRDNNLPDVAALRSAARMTIEEEKKERNESHQKKQIVDFIVSHVDFPLPQRYIDMQIDAIIQVNRMFEQENDGKSEEEVRVGARQNALRMLRFFVTAREIARKEGIIATDAELAIEVTKRAYDEGRDDIREYIRELRNNGHIEGIRDMIVVRKTLDYIVEQSEATDHILP